MSELQEAATRTQAKLLSPLPQLDSFEKRFVLVLHLWVSDLFVSDLVVSDLVVSDLMVSDLIQVSRVLPLFPSRIQQRKH
jgi:hypothetical protein